MPVTHEPWLVVLSLIVAIQGAYVGLSLAVQIADAEGVRRRLLLAGSAISLAVAIWSMHFVGMLAARLPFPVDYLVFPTLLSFLVCVIVVGAAVFTASAGPPSKGRLALAAVVMGSGISAMHYIGMTALHASAHMEHSPLFVAASVFVGIAASGLALWLAGGHGRLPLLFSATAFGIAVAGMHYTAMAGLDLYPHDVAVSGAPALSPDLLAIVVSIVAFIVSGIFLLTLVPDRSTRAGREAVQGPAARALGAAVPASGDTYPAELSPGDIGHGTFAPLGGAGGPPRRPATHLPIEQSGATRFLPVEEVVAVHANAHYTYVFDGKAKLFCALSIGEVEQRLGGGRFLRVHRSHIVNVERIRGLKRAGDAGVIDLASEAPYSVPVSRNRFNDLRSRLGIKVGVPAPV